MSGLPDGKLLGWLVVTRYNIDVEGNENMILPPPVVDGLKRLGWIEDSEDSEPWRPRAGCVSITDAGKAATDLVAEEWGLELDFEGSDA